MNHTLVRADGSSAQAPSNHRPAVTVDMLKAFVTLAETLNLKETAEILGTTRQTIRRHIDHLEIAKGGALFALKKQTYVMTERGSLAVEGARSILRDLEQWTQSKGRAGQGAGFLEAREFRDSDDRRFYSQQHPVSHISRIGTDLMKSVVAAWGQAAAQIESEAFEDIKRSLVIYRRSKAGWVCVAVGAQSAYAEWFGQTWAKSAIGRLFHEDNAGDDINAFVSDAYQRIYRTGGIRHDHVFAFLPRPGITDPVPVTFQRLLIGCIFPDGSPALAVAVDVSKNVDIPALPAELRRHVSEDLEMSSGE